MALKSDAVCTLSYTMTLSTTPEALPRAKPHRLQLPFADGSFDLLCALDIIEHVDDDRRAIAELSRVAARGAPLLVSTPLPPERWTPSDDFVDHRRRYEPKQIQSLLQRNRLAPLPKSSNLSQKMKGYGT